jgi:nucleotide-binding universal stress UspA family protein
MPTSSQSFGSILCPVDLSASSRAALKVAAVIADQFHAQMTALFVDDPLLSKAALKFDEEELARRTRAELTRFVERAIGERRRCTYEIVNGEPAAEILDAAGRLKADLIVMGTQGASGPKRLFFGSTADAVLRRSTIPVLVVPPKSR